MNNKNSIMNINNKIIENIENNIKLINEYNGLKSNIFMINFKVDSILCNYYKELKWDSLVLILETISIKLLQKIFKYSLVHVENDIKLSKPISLNSILYIKCEVKEYQDLILYTNIEVGLDSVLAEPILRSSHSYFIKNGFHFNYNNDIKNKIINTNMPYNKNSLILNSLKSNIKL